MESKYLIQAGAVIVLIAALTGCNNNREKKVEVAKERVQQANLDLKDAQSEYEREWQEFKSAAELKISINQKRIDEFKVEIKTASPKFKTKYEKEISVLEQKNIELKKKISEYKYEGKDKWEEFKKEFNRDIDVVGNALKDIFAKKD